MTNSTRDLLWDERQRVLTAQTRRERRAWMKNFVLVLGLIVITLAVALALAGRNL